MWSKVKPLREANGKEKSCLDGLAEFEVEQLLEKYGRDIPVGAEVDILDEKHEEYRRQYCTARCYRPQGCHYYFQCLEAEFGYDARR